MDSRFSQESPEISQRRLQKSRNRTRLVDSLLSADDFEPGTRVAIYIRVCSEEQIDGFSLSAQERACREFAERRGWDIVALYEDPGHSGKNDRRPGFQAMIEAAHRREFQVLVFHKLDRLSRSLENTLKYFHELFDNDVTIASVTEFFDFASPMGRMLFHVLAVFAQWYLENLSAETIKGKHERVRGGLHNGRLPFGYEVGPDGVAMIVLEEAEAVRKCFELYSTGEYTDRQVASYLNQEGFITRQRRHWSKDTLRSVLQNEFYYGKVAYREQLMPGRHEPIISAELFEKCQEVRRQHANRPKSYGNTGPQNNYLLQRIIRCNTCERHLRMQSAKYHYYYKEASMERGLACDHAGMSIRMDLADKQILDILSVLRLPEDWQDELRRQMEDEDEARRIEARRQQLQEQLRRLGRAYADGAYSDDEYEEKRMALQNELESLVVPDASRVFEAGLQLEQLGSFLEDATDVERAEIAHLMLTAVYADLEEKLIVRLRPSPEFVFMFRLAAPEMGCQETEPGIFTLSA